MTQLIPGNSFGFLLTDLARLYRQTFEKAVEQAGIKLTPGEVRTLAYVARFKQSRQAELAERMGVEPMTISVFLNRLEAQGLIERTVDAADRRAKIISVTDAAEEAFVQARPVATAVFERATRGISAEELKAAQDIFVRMHENLVSDTETSAS